MLHDEKIWEKICRFHVLWLTLHRNWDDESWLRGLSYGVMVALQFLVLPVEVRILVRQPQFQERFPTQGYRSFCYASFA